MNIVELIKNGKSKTFEFKENGSFVSLVFHRKKIKGKQTEPIKKNKGANDCGQLRTITDDCGQLSDEEKKILLYLMDNKKITRKIAMEILKFKKTKVHQILSELKTKRYIEQQGKGKSTYYILKREK